MSDVGERPAMDEREVVLERLHQVRGQRLSQNGSHRPVRLDVPRQHGLLLARVAHHDLAEPLFQIPETGREAEDRHHLGCHHDVEAVLARIAVGRAAEARRDVAQRAVVDVQHAPPGHAAQVEAQLVAPVDVVVDQRGQQIVGEPDGGEVAGEMQVDVFHRHDLRVAAAGGPALHAEDGAQGGFPQADHGLLADAVERIPQADRHRGLAFPRRGGRDRRHQHELAVRPFADVLAVIERQLGLVRTVTVQMLFRNAEPLHRQWDDGLHLRVLGNFDVAQWDAATLRCWHGPLFSAGCLRKHIACFRRACHRRGD